MPDNGKKTRVLFSIVGMRDPYSGPTPGQLPDLDAEGTLYEFEGSVLTVCRKVRPDILYLFPSGKAKASPPDNHTEGKAEEIKAIVEGWTGGPKCKVRPLDVANPADVDEVYGCFQDHILKIIDKLKRDYPLDGYELFVDTTSGTPQMSDATRLCLAAHLPLEPTYCQSFDPARLQGRERVVFPKSPLPEVVLMKHIDGNVEGYHFHSLIGDCESLMKMTKLPRRRGVAGILQNVFLAYEKMDFMQYGKAHSIISKIPGDLLPQNIDAIIKDQERFLDHVKDEQVTESVHNLVDLYFNMERAFARGNYVDVLARFWRLREGMMYYRLLKRYGVDKHNDFNEPPNLGALSRILVMDFKDIEFKAFKRHFKDVRKCEYIDPHDRQEKRIGIIECLRLVRNNSIVAHGMAPVQKEEAEMCMEIGKEIIKLIPGGQDVYDEYPFTLENMRALVDLLKKV